MIGKQTVVNALVFRDLFNAEGIRSKALTVCSGAWGGSSTWTVRMESIVGGEAGSRLGVQEGAGGCRECVGSEYPVMGCLP